MGSGFTPGVCSLKRRASLGRPQVQNPFNQPVPLPSPGILWLCGVSQSHWVLLSRSSLSCPPSPLLSPTHFPSPRGFCMDSGMPACFLWAPLKEHLRFFVAAHLVLYLSGAAGVGPQLLACVCSWLLGGHSCLFAWMEEQGQYEMGSRGLLFQEEPWVIKPRSY